MKWGTAIGMLVGILLLLPVTGAYAHYVWFEPSGKVSAKPADTISVDVYLHASEDDTVYGWGVNLGFDDSAFGTGELTYQSFSLGSGIGSMGSVDEYQGYEANQSLVTPGEGIIRAGRYDWSFAGLPLVADTDYLLFTADFTFTDGGFDGSDIWVEWAQKAPYESFFDLDSAFYGRNNPMMGQLGPDYGVSRRKGQPWVPLLLDKEPKATTLGQEESGSE